MATIDSELQKYVRSLQCYEQVYDQAASEYDPSRPDNWAFHPITDAMVEQCVLSIYNLWGGGSRSRFRTENQIKDVIRKQLVVKVDQAIRDVSLRIKRAKDKCPVCGKTAGFTMRNTEGVEEAYNKFDYPDLMTLGIFTHAKICKDCYRKDLATLRAVDTERRRDKIREMDACIENCEIRGTCGTFHVHHDILIDDPERLRSSFMIGMACGTDGLRRYLSKRGKLSIEELFDMTDEEVVEYSDRF